MNELKTLFLKYRRGARITLTLEFPIDSTCISSKEWLIIAISMFIKTMIMTTWYIPNRYVPTASTMAVLLCISFWGSFAVYTSKEKPQNLQGIQKNFLKMKQQPNIKRSRVYLCMSYDNYKDGWILMKRKCKLMLQMNVSILLNIWQSQCGN